MNEKDKIYKIIKEKGLSSKDILEIIMRIWKDSHWTHWKKYFSEFESYYQKEKFKYFHDYPSDMESLYDKLREEEIFEPDAPTNFTISFHDWEDYVEGVNLVLKYGSITSKPSIKPAVGCSIIISRTQLLALKDSGFRFFPTYDKCFIKR